MRYFYWLVVLVLGVGGVSQALGDPPNIIMILTDDQGVDAIEGPSVGSFKVWPNTLRVRTPVLRSLAEQGTVFRYARANSICSPTRAGLLTGRHAIRTGVTGIATKEISHPDRDLLTLQGHETTIGEVLQGAGYHTIHADKWHVGWADEQGALAQGFDESFARLDYIEKDLPNIVGDEHHSLMVDMSVDAYLGAGNGPKALLFWTYVPHKRWEKDDAGFNWWEVDRDLLPSYEEERYYEGEQTQRRRYRALIESLDTEIGRMLFELGVIDKRGFYRPQSDTVVFFMSDNGTPREVAPVFNHAKRSLFEGGTRVPLFVFGAGVESGQLVSNPISHVDVYDTIADVAGVALTERGDLPRDSMSFADELGYGKRQTNREYSLSSQGHTDPLLHRVALTDGEYKLMAPAGWPGFAPQGSYAFYDLKEDGGEMDDLMVNVKGMTRKQSLALLRLLDELPKYWGSSVSQPLPNHVDIPFSDIMAITSGDKIFRKGKLPVGFTDGGTESRIFIRFDADQLDDLLPAGRGIGDIVGAEVIGVFAEDSPEEGETGTDLLRIHPMFLDWFSQTRSFGELANGFVRMQIGSFDVAPHVIPKPGAEGKEFIGVPMVAGCPMSFGNSSQLASLVKLWYQYPTTNLGMVLRTKEWPEMAGDQRVFLQSRAVLRLTLTP